MKVNCARCASVLLLLAALTSQAWCQDTSRPELFPMPPLPSVSNGYSVSQTNADMVWGPNELSPVQTGPIQTPVQSPMQKSPSVMTPEYTDAMKGGYGSCTSSVGSPCGGSVCCSNHYVYANALLMSALKPNGIVTSIDSNTGGQRLNFCNQEFGNLWSGGFEIGTGWCFGGCGSCCNTNALEVVYWGMFPATATVGATGNVDSTLDFSDLSYNGANAQVPFTNSNFQQISYGYSFNSLEANLVGNSWSGGPFGCGMCGGCNGSPWGFGYTAGFRYINFHDNFLFSASPAGTAIVGDPSELNYSAATTNNLFGFQLGAGLSYCVTDRFTAYCISKCGIYDNSVTALQRVGGTAGNAVILNGPNTGEDFVVRTAARDTLAVSGQFDLGARWAITNNWSANFGYRVLGLAGVATTDVNVQQSQFHDVAGIASVNRNGTFLLHGLFAGATYCW